MLCFEQIVLNMVEEGINLSLSVSLVFLNETPSKDRYFFRGKVFVFKNPLHHNIFYFSCSQFFEPQMSLNRSSRVSHSVNLEKGASLSCSVSKSGVRVFLPT